MDDLFPRIQKNIETLIEDEEGNIPGNKLLALGTMVLILGTLFPLQGFAGHSSHRSHSSHKSHSSGSGGGHESHVSHQSHQSHQSGSDHSNHSNHGSHASHTSHSNTGAHSNSRYSAEGDVAYAPTASTIQGISVEPIRTTEELFQLPVVNQNIESPNGTPGSGIIPNISMPASTVGVKMNPGDLDKPPATDIVE